MKTLEEMGNTLVNTALHYTHPNYSDMYPDWGVVCNIGETLIEMSNQPTLNDNQQIVLDYLTKENNLTNEAPILSINNFSDKHFGAKLPENVEKAYRELNADEDFQVLAAFVAWGQSEVQDDTEV